MTTLDVLLLSSIEDILARLPFDPASVIGASAQTISFLHDFVESGQEHIDMVGGRAFPHQSDPPDFAGEFAQSSADLDAVFAQQNPTDRSIIGICRNLDGIELWQTKFRLHEELEAELL